MNYPETSFSRTRPEALYWEKFRGEQFALGMLQTVTKNQLVKATLPESGALIDELSRQTWLTYPGITVVNYYRVMNEGMPQYLPYERNKQALDAVLDRNPDVAKNGKKCSLF
jgi:hypothetical protein